MTRLFFSIVLATFFAVSGSVLASDDQTDHALDVEESDGSAAYELYAQKQSSSCGTTNNGYQWPDAVCPRSPCPAYQEAWCVGIDELAGDRYPGLIFECTGTEWYDTGQLCDQLGTKCVWGECGRGNW